VAAESDPPAAVFCALKGAWTARRLTQNETEAWSEAGQRLTHFESVSEQKRDNLTQPATERLKAILKNMTKVIFVRTDESGGCRNAPPEDLETPIEETK
jgi:hypothetical protein